LAAARTRQAAIHAPGVGQPTVVMDRDLPGLQQPVRYAQGVAAPVQARTAGVSDRLVGFDSQREVALQEFVRYVREARPQRMAVGPVADRPARHAAEADGVKLVPLAGVA